MSCGLKNMDHVRKSSWPSPQTPACGLDFGSRYVKLVYSLKQGGWGRRKVDSIVFYRDYLVRLEGEVRI
ncbi:MAG: hypothetical protein Q7V36_02980, partial [Deltaproteobacteria bacterium]|nr:hypothetical protein [Deltaproteobacteria bacterium]